MVPPLINVSAIMALIRMKGSVTGGLTPRNAAWCACLFTGGTPTYRNAARTNPMARMNGTKAPIAARRKTQTRVRKSHCRTSETNMSDNRRGGLPHSSKIDSISAPNWPRNAGGCKATIVR